jgi:7-cyano-7-deazaguanine synthase
MPDTERVAVLASGGIDSAVLVAALLEEGREVQPIYLRFGLVWEEAERQGLQRFLSSLNGGTRLRPLLVLEEPVGAIYGSHWSTTGRGVPDAESPDSAVALPGRNLLLLAKPIVWCSRNGFESIALGVLAANPFPDARPSFYEACERVAREGLELPLTILTPFAGLTKRDVLRKGAHLPLAWTFSCIAPREGIHCGCCNKCGERRRAFAELAIVDDTIYAAALSSLPAAES